MVMPCWQALPKFLAETKYQNPTDPAHCAFQEGHNTEQMAFQWALSVPSRFDNFNLWMAATHEGQNTFLDVYPFEKELCYCLKPETPLFVDVGGGIGQQCLALKQKLPHLSGRVINQDLPPAIAQALPCEGVEHTVHDFTTKQPIEGNYLRNATASDSTFKSDHV
jgi:demethylsterigmatocystin 6-O-methyltransferase